MYNKDYCLVNGITYDKVINLIPYFDILDVDFIYYMADFWLVDEALGDNTFNKEVFATFCDTAFKIEFPIIIDNHGKFMGYSIDWSKKVVNFIVIGTVENKIYKEILKLFRTEQDEKLYKELKMKYENS